MSEGKPAASAAKAKAKANGGLPWSLLIAALPALVSLVAAASSYYSAREASEKAEVLERYKIEREGQFKVYERVESQLSSTHPYNLVMASAYIQLVEDVAIRRALCETIRSIAFNQLASDLNSSDRQRIEGALRDVTRVARDCIESMVFDTPANPAAVASPGAAPGSDAGGALNVQARAAEQAPVTAVLNGATAPATGWDIDVFWCQSQGNPSRLLADRTAQLLAVPNLQFAGEAVGRVRLRSVTPEAQQRLAPRPDNRVFGSANEERFATAIADGLNQSIENANFSYSRTEAASRWYVSIFTCRPSA